MLVIAGYEDRYKVSRDGAIWSCTYNRFLKPSINCGYYRVLLNDGLFKNSCYVHRLVATAFIPNPYNKRTINHIDGNKLNNIVENLEWATHSENTCHAYDIGLQVGCTRETKKVLQYTLDGKLVAEYDSHDEATYFLGLKHRALKSVLSGHRATAFGFIWKYKEDTND